MQYTKPNLNREWNEARRYSFLKKMGKKAWVEFASKNFQILNYESIKDQLGNVDLDYENLDKDKKIRFERDFKKGVIEIPIAVKIYEDYYDLVGGNTRLAGLIKNNINPKLWVIDATDKIDVEDPIEMQLQDGEGVVEYQTENLITSDMQLQDLGGGMEEGD